MKSPLSFFAWVMLGAAVVASLAIDWRNAAQGGAEDLRNRITGSRLLAHGIDPYHYKWHAGDPEAFCDPYDNPRRPVSRTTVTPAFLMVYEPLAVLPYRTARFVWLICQWGLLLGTGWLWWRATENSRARWLILLAVVGFSFSVEWRLHAERGQCYVLLTFLLTCWATATLSSRPNRDFRAGCLTGFLAALRPPFLLLLPFLVVKRRGQLPGAATGLLLGVGLPMLLLPACWSQYFASTQTFSNIYRNQIHFPPIPDNTYPSFIEGIPLHHMIHALYLPDGIFSVHALLLRRGLEPFPSWPPLLALGLTFAAWLWLVHRQPISRLIPGITGWLFLSDLFLPVIRESYDDVLILGVIGAALAVTPRFPCMAWPCFLALPMAAVVYFRDLDHPWVMFPSTLFTIGAMIALFPSRQSEEART